MLLNTYNEGALILRYVWYYDYCIKHHYPALLLAIGIGCITVAPYLYFTTTPSYQGVALLGQDAEDYYVARIHEVYEGHVLSNNAYLPYKEVPYMVPALGEDIVAALGKTLLLTAPEINIFSKFLFPLCVFLLAYALMFSMSRSRGAALLGATLAILGTGLMSYPSGIMELVRGRSLQDGVYWARPINPEISGVLLFGTLLLMYRSFIQSRKLNTWNAILCGALVGVSLYVSVYIWLFLGALLLLLFVYSLWRRNYLVSKYIFVSGILGILFTVPFIINHLHAVTYPGYLLASLQFGVLASHAPVIGIWVLALLIIPLWWSPRLSDARIFFVVSALALGLLLNQQILTGVYLQPGHFHWYITKPLVGLMLGVCSVFIIEYLRVPHMVRLFGCTAVIAALLAVAALSQIHFYEIHAPDAIAAQEYTHLFNYLNQDTEHEVVFADALLSSYIPLYTSADAPNAEYAGLFIAPEQYLEQRLFLEYKLRGIAPTDALSKMETERATILSRIYGIYWSTEAGNGNPDTALRSMTDQYVSAYNESVVHMMRGLGTTLIVRDRVADQWTIPHSSELKQTARIANRFEVYTLQPRSI